MPRARLLDLTRSMRRAGRVATGIDRVERAYLDRFLAETETVFGIVRTPLGYLLLDRPGLADFARKLDSDVPWGPVTLLSRISRARPATVRQAESDLRRVAVAKARRGRLPSMLTAHLTGGFDYYNVGHSNLTERMLRAVGKAQGQVHVLVHDVIPLDYPQHQRPETVEPFRAKMQRVSTYADRVIYNSKDTRTRSERYFTEWGRVPVGIVAHLGTVPPKPDTAELPQGLPPDPPYFVTVGTIEPRKNHAFLLDIWDQLGPDAPPLLICGNRGWNNDAVFARLDAMPAGGPVTEVTGLADPALAYLVKHSAGILFPSVAEGFGLPPVEALALGARVLCNDLPVLHESLGDNAVYAGVNERYLWINTIKSWASNPPDVQESAGFSVPTWNEHFKTVLRLI